MGKIEVTFEVPEDAYLTLSSSGYTRETIVKEAKRLFSAFLFKKGNLSLEKASEMAGISISAFIDLLNELEIPVIDYDEEELSAEFKTAREPQV